MGELEVLIVDDEPMAAELHRMFVDRTPGFVVMGVASSGEDALRTIRRRTPDVVLLDLQLPGISGAEVLHAVRRDHGDAIEVIAVTADHRASSVSQMRMLVWRTTWRSRSRCVSCRRGCGQWHECATLSRPASSSPIKRRSMT